VINIFTGGNDVKIAAMLETIKTAKPCLYTEQTASVVAHGIFRKVIYELHNDLNYILFTLRIVLSFLVKTREKIIRKAITIHIMITESVMDMSKPKTES